jgi:hypothetical protein|tara:strand:- start:443 stop:724 length:282 start_codon:yes stop_codon:yes gene_type:complete
MPIEISIQNKKKSDRFLSAAHLERGIRQIEELRVHHVDYYVQTSVVPGEKSTKGITQHGKDSSKKAKTKARKVVMNINNLESADAEKILIHGM